MKQLILATWRRTVVICTVTLMGLAWAIVAHAGPTQTAEGVWEYLPRPPAPTDHPPIFLNCDELPYEFLVPMITMLTEDGRWSGTFNGASVESGTLIIRCAGSLSFFATATFDEVEVNGKVGRLYMHVEGAKPDPFADWCGTWSILDGMDELAHLRGHGTWWGPGYTPVLPDVWGRIYYDGKIKWTRKPSHLVDYRKCQDSLCDDDDDSDSD